MYIIETMKSPDFDGTEFELESNYDDLVNAIYAKLPEESIVALQGSVISIKTTLNEKELKDRMKPAFTYHFDNIRYVSIVKYQDSQLGQ
jgi:hypothetical protein